MIEFMNFTHVVRPIINSALHGLGNPDGSHNMNAAADEIPICQSCSTGVGIDVPFLGISSTSPNQPYLLEMKYSLFSWVM